jgi:phosphoserine aminotransferase
MSDTIYFTPGPSHPHSGLRSFLDDALADDIVTISHRGAAFSEVYARTDAALRGLMDIPADYHLMFVGSATEAMERVIQGLVANRSHHFIGGSFAEKWFEIAEQLGKKPTATRVEPGQSFSEADLMVPADTELVCVTQNETSTGTAFADEALLALTRLPERPLVAVDVVSSAPLSELPWQGLDAVFFSVQKAFGLPAGLGVLVASPRALAKSAELRARGLSLGSYHSLPQLAAAAAKFQTPETPNVLGIYLLSRVAEDFNKQGADRLRRENRARAQIIYEVIDNHAELEPFVTDPRWRSPTVIVTTVKNGNHALHQYLKDQGLVLGQGYRPYQEEHLRIANFPAIDRQSFDHMIKHLKRYRPKPAK